MSHFNAISVARKAMVHAFVLMSNHYHLIVSTHEEHDLGIVMCDFQKSVSKAVNRISERTNHVFGGAYKGSLITNPVHYANVLKYVLRNPVAAGICSRSLNYPYSTLTRGREVIHCSLVDPISHAVPYRTLNNWVDEDRFDVDPIAIKRGLLRTRFKPIATRKY